MITPEERKRLNDNLDKAMEALKQMHLSGMSIDELVEKMKKVNKGEHAGDKGAIHVRIDDLLLDYINDERVAAEYKRWAKWYE